MEKLLFIMKRSRLYLETAVSFLTARVSKGDVKTGEIEKSIEVFHCTLKEKRFFGAKKLDEISTWVDASYTLHYNTKSQTGRGAMFMGLSVTHCRSIKQKLNTKISTETELVGTSDYVPYNIWYIMFMHHQGYLNKSNKFFQDNQSAMMMEVTGRNSRTENLRNIDTRYFLSRIGWKRIN